MKLKLTVFDENNKKVYCLIVLRDLTYYPGENARGKVEKIYCNGEYEFDLNNGVYEVAVYKGKMYQPFRERIKLYQKDLALEIRLKKMIDSRAMRLYSFDAHSHVSRDAHLKTGDLVKASSIMKGEDYNFFFAGSPYDNDVHMQYLNGHFTDKVPYREKFAPVIEKVNDENFILDIGNEIIKCRYGHVFMMNYTQKPPFSKYYDNEFDPWLFTKVGEEPEYRIPYIYEAVLKERDDNSVAVLAHPTSWWWHDNGEFITNIGATLGFEILAGSIDAMVIMGYRSDHKYYQELWYEALNNGYFLPGVAENDAAYDIVPDNHLAYKTYTYIDEFSIDSLCRSVKQGRNIVSSGPIVTLKVNGELPGTVLRYSPGQNFEIEIEAYRCYQALLSDIQIIINGEVYKEYNICRDTFKLRESISIDKDSFVIAKCYDFAGNTAITNPVYIRNKPFVNRGYLSDVSVTVTKDGKGAEGVYWLDDTDERIPFQTSIKLKMKVSSKLNIQVDGCVRTIRLFELPELQRIFKNLYFGWFNKDKKYRPGEVPAHEFKLARIREILDHVEMCIDF